MFLNNTGSGKSTRIALGRVESEYMVEATTAAAGVLVY